MALGPSRDGHLLLPDAAGRAPGKPAARAPEVQMRLMSSDDRVLWACAKVGRRVGSLFFLLTCCLYMLLVLGSLHIAGSWLYQGHHLRSFNSSVVYSSRFKGLTRHPFYSNHLAEISLALFSSQQQGQGGIDGRDQVAMGLTDQSQPSIPEAAVAEEHAGLAASGDLSSLKPCWASPMLWSRTEGPWESRLHNHSSAGARLLSDGAHSPRTRSGIMVYGDGCHTCTVGEPCSFNFLLVGPEAFWHPAASRGPKPHPPDPQDPFDWDLMVTLAGPALANVEVEPLAPGARLLKMTYRTWDAGNYRVSVRAPCINLEFPGSNYNITDEVAAWHLSVLPTANSTVPGAPKERRRAPSSPCKGSIQARWLLRDGEYRWTFYDCAVPLPPIEQLPELLWQKGVRVINFMGDSHMRVLAYHLYHLLVARELNSNKTTFAYADLNRKASHRFRIDLPSEGGETKGGSSEKYLIINQWWHVGLYDCNPATDNFANYSRALLNRTSVRSDVLLMNIGTWTGCYCNLPEVAVIPHLDTFFSYVAGLSKGRPRNRNVYRSTPPRYQGATCMTTNSFISFQNKVAREMERWHRFQDFDSWQVEAPRFSETCSQWDHHYSCLLKNPSTNTSYFGGDIGQATVLSLVHFLLFTLR